MTFDNLPFVDGNRYSGSGVRAGFYPYVDGKRLTYKEMKYAETDDTAKVTFTGTKIGDFRITLCEEGISFDADADFELKNESKKGGDEPEKRTEGKDVVLKYRGFEYRVTVKEGVLKDYDTFISSSGRLFLQLC